MSHFIANTITIAKDFKTFKIKGGDNNVVPRNNYWIDNLPIEDLHDMLSGGILVLNSRTEKALFIQHLVFHSKHRFGGSYSEGTSYYVLRRLKPIPPIIEEFDKAFLKRLIDGLKILSTKKEYSIDTYMGYILKYSKKYASTTQNKENAEKFSKYIAMDIVERFQTAEPVIFLNK